MKSDPDIIVQPPKTYDPNLPEKVVNFELTMKNLKLLREAAYNFGVTDFCVNSFQGESCILSPCRQSNLGSRLLGHYTYS